LTADTFDSFDGNYLGWVPTIAEDSAPTAAGYDQVVTSGAAVLPGTGVDDTQPGLADGRSLATANAGSGLGIATMGARLLLLIPVSADAGQYRAQLTFTTIDLGG